MARHEAALKEWALNPAITDRQIQAEMLWRTEELRRMVRLFYVLTIIWLVLTVLWLVIVVVAVVVELANGNNDFDDPFGMLTLLGR